MTSSRPFWLTLSERTGAFGALVLMLPSLFVTGLFIHLTAGHPIVLTDSFATTDGASVQCHRFRTTGSGSPIFHAVGRLFSRCGIDDLPAIWSIVCGDITAGEFLKILRNNSGLLHPHLFSWHLGQRQFTERCDVISIGSAFTNSIRELVRPVSAALATIGFQIVVER